MLAFLWAGGFAVLLLLLVFSLTIGAGFSLSFTELALHVAQTVADADFPAFLWAVLTAGFLIKLMLQPFQFFLLSFYKRLAFSTFSIYIAFYYIFLIPTVILVFGPGLSLLIPA